VGSLGITTNHEAKIMFRKGKIGHHVFLSIFLISFAFAQYEGQGDVLADKNDEKVFDDLFYSALMTEGDEYIDIKEKIFGLDFDVLPLLIEKKYADDWQVRTLACILILSTKKKNPYETLSSIFEKIVSRRHSLQNPFKPIISNGQFRGFETKDAMDFLLERLLKDNFSATGKSVFVTERRFVRGIKGPVVRPVEGYPPAFAGVVRIVAAYALGENRDEDIIQPLIYTLKFHRERGLVAEVTEAILKVGSIAVLESLKEEYEKESSPEVKSRYRNVIVRLEKKLSMEE
jgi:hypothetical protein